MFRQGQELVATLPSALSWSPTISGSVHIEVRPVPALHSKRRPCQRFPESGTLGRGAFRSRQDWAIGSWKVVRKGCHAADHYIGEVSCLLHEQTSSEPGDCASLRVVSSAVRTTHPLAIIGVGGLRACE